MKHFNLKKRAFAALLMVFALCCGNYLHAAEITHNISTGSLTIPSSSSNNYIITGTTEEYSVIVQSGYKGTITMRDLSITDSAYWGSASSGNVSPFHIQGKDNQSNWNPVTIVNIILEGDNFLRFYGDNYAALQVDQGAQINISAIDPSNNASGTLYATANISPQGDEEISGGGAGIGSAICYRTNDFGSIGTSVIKNKDGTIKYDSAVTAGGNIIITSGTITAYGSHGAGIGGGFDSWYNGIIILTGGDVKASAGFDAAGIGSGCPEGHGVEEAYADMSAIIALPPCNITAIGAGENASGGMGWGQFAELGLAGARYLAYVNDPAKPEVTIHTEGFEKNADIYLDLTETKGLKDIFDKVYPTFDLTHVWIGKTGASDGLVKVHGIFQDSTTFFTDASSTDPATLGRPYMPVSATTPELQDTTIILPLFEADMRFTDYPSVPLAEGYPSTEAEKNAYCLKIEYNDDLPLTGLSYQLQMEAASSFKDLIFLASDSTTKLATAPTTFNKGDVYYIVAPLKDGKPIGIYMDVILIKGTYKGITMSGYIRRISDQLVVKDDTDTNNHIKVTADPVTFMEDYPTSKTVDLTLNITHTGFDVPYDPATVRAKYLITTEQNYDAALAATPLNQWANLAIPSADGGNAVTTASFAGKKADTYYIHWYVVSGLVMAHSKDVTDPARNYGGFGKYEIIVRKTVTYDGNANNGGAVPVDAIKYIMGDSVTVLGNTGALTKTDATFIGWSFAVSGIVTTPADEPADLMNANNKFEIVTDTTLYAVWAIDKNGPGGGSDSIPDYMQFAVTYDGNGNTSGTAPTDAGIYSNGDNVTAKTHGTLAKTAGLTPIVFAGWTPAPVSNVLTNVTAADTTTAFVRAGGVFTITSNTTMYAVWSTDTNGNDIPDIFETGYHVTYNGNGHTSGTAPVDTTTYLSGMIVTAKAHGTLAKTDGLTPILFAGWTPAPVSNVLTNATAADTTTAFVRADGVFTLADNTTLYAVWSTDENDNGKPDIFETGYNVTYDGNGATSGTAPVDATIYLSGMTVTTQAHGNLAKTGGLTPIVFAGWTPAPVSNVLTNVTAADTTTAFVRAGGVFTLAGNTTMYAVWSTDENDNGKPDIFETGYNVTYDGNGATSGTAPSDATTYLDGMNVITQSQGNLLRTNAAFLGWSTSAVSVVTTAAQEAAANVIVSASAFVITGNTTLYAVWAEDLNGPGGGSDSIPDYLQFSVTYDGNGGTGAVVDNNIYNNGMDVTLKAKGNLVKTNRMFLGWNPSVVSDILTQSEEDALVSSNTMKQPGETFTIAGHTTWYAVWALDNDGNNIPDYKQAVITYNKGSISLSSVTGLPQKQVVAKGDTLVLSDMGAFGRYYKLVGWNTTSVPLINSLMMENLVLKMGQFYAVGESLVITQDMALHAVWVIDQNNDGKPDYAGSEFNQVGFRRGDVTVFSGSATDNEEISGTRVWSYENTLYIQSDKAVRANIYTLNGMLFKQLNVPEGMTSEPLKGGIYIVEIDGSRYKVVVK